jgi:hypothetical protein
MHAVSMAKLTFHATADQFSALHQTQVGERDALDHVSHDAFAHANMSNVALVRVLALFDGLRAPAGKGGVHAGPTQHGKGTK